MLGKLERVRAARICIGRDAEPEHGEAKQLESHARQTASSG